MLYALLCYNDEDTVWAWDKKQEGEVMERLGVVRDRLEKAGKLGPSLRLLPTTAATTFRKSDPPLVSDANPGGAYEIRPLAVYNSGSPAAVAQGVVTA